MNEPKGSSKAMNHAEVILRAIEDNDCTCGAEADDLGNSPGCWKHEAMEALDTLRTQLEEARADLSVMTQARNELTQQLAARDAEAEELRASLQAAIQRAEKAERTAKIQAEHAGEVEKENLHLESALAAARKALEGIADERCHQKLGIRRCDAEVGRCPSCIASAALERINGDGHDK